MKVYLLFLTSLLVVHKLLAAPPPPGGNSFQNFRSVERGIPPATASFVDWTNSLSISSGKAALMTNNISVGDTIVVSVGWEDADFTWSVSDSAGNTYTSLIRTNSTTTAPTGLWTHTFYAVNVSAGGANIIITPTNNSASSCSFIKGQMMRFRGVTAFDSSSHGTNIQPNAFCNTGNFNTVNPVEALFCVSHNYNARTLSNPGTGWTTDYNTLAGINSQHQITTSSGTYFGAVTNSGSAVCVTIAGAFK